jgi:SAM-dependent methyltransferase
MKEDKTIHKQRDVKNYYQKDDVAKKYITKRFTEPLNYVEHKKQVAIINKIIKLNNINNLLEFAPGPARLTTELNFQNGTSIDASASMLKIARKRMQDINKPWKFIEGDIFNLKLKTKFDFIFGIRFFLHFKYEERKKIYQQAHKILNSNGLLAFEVMNKEVVLPLRKILGKKRYFVYDELYLRKNFIKEMNSNGFKVVKMYPILRHFWWQTLLSRPFKIFKLNNQAIKLISHFEKYKTNKPYQWIALCQKM